MAPSNDDAAPAVGASRPSAWDILPPPDTALAIVLVVSALLHAGVMLTVGVLDANSVAAPVTVQEIPVELVTEEKAAAEKGDSAGNGEDAEGKGAGKGKGKGEGQGDAGKGAEKPASSAQATEKGAPPPPSDKPAASKPSEKAAAPLPKDKAEAPVRPPDREPKRHETPLPQQAEAKPPEAKAAPQAEPLKTPPAPPLATPEPPKAAAPAPPSAPAPPRPAFQAAGAMSFGLSPQSYRAVAMPAPVPAGEEEVAYKRLVFGMLAEAKHFPDSARARRASGTAVVAFSLDQKGNVLSVSLARSSGEADIDAEVVALVRRAAPFPPPPPGALRSFAAAIQFGQDE